MTIGQKIREFRESGNFSQGDIEHRTGLIRCYTSRVENGHTIPSIATLQKYARAFEVPLYRFFYDGDDPPKKPRLPAIGRIERVWGLNGDERRELQRFSNALSHMNDRDRKLLLAIAQHMTRRGSR
jgi:transcriptional regulator with XRE-family HTH domain